MTLLLKERRLSQFGSSPSFARVPCLGVYESIFALGSKTLVPVRRRATQRLLRGGMKTQPA